MQRRTSGLVSFPETLLLVRVQVPARPLTLSGKKGHPMDRYRQVPNSPKIKKTAYGWLYSLAEFLFSVLLIVLFWIVTIGVSRGR